MGNRETGAVGLRNCTDDTAPRVNYFNSDVHALCPYPPAAPASE